MATMSTETALTIHKWHACVCEIQLPEGSGTGGCGTGFLIAPDMIMTCAHVFKSIVNDKRYNNLTSEELKELERVTVSFKDVAYIKLNPSSVSRKRIWIQALSNNGFASNWEVRLQGY